MRTINVDNTIYNTQILLVDDDPDLLTVFDFFLKSEGYKNVKYFPDSKSAIRFTMENIQNFKLAILDIRMPDINGIQLYQILKILNPLIKVMFLTSLDEVYRLTGVFSEVIYKDIIKKPVDRINFIKKVNCKIKKDIPMA